MITNCTSLIFDIKSLCQISENDVKKIEYKTVYWVNFRLFDHTKSLKTGIQKISTWETFYFDLLKLDKSKVIYFI